MAKELSSLISEKQESSIVEESKTGGKITVLAKQIKRLTLISVKNSADEHIFGIEIKISNGNIKFVKASGWDREKIDSRTVMIKTTDRPIASGGTKIVLLIFDNPNVSLEWSAFDKDMKAIGGGT